MLDLQSLLEIRYYNGSTYSDYRISLGQPASSTVDVTLDTTDYLYIGYYKPVQQIYLDIPTPNTNAATLTAEYWDGTAWTAISAIDSTEGLTRSGMIQWEELSDWDETTVDSSEKYWLRVSTDTLHTAATYNFIGLVYSEDRGLTLQVPYILDSAMLSGESSHFKYHIAARDSIVRELINKGYSKIDSAGDRQSLTAWDLLDISEVRQAAEAKVLSLIYFNASDSAEDHWMDKSIRFNDEYQKLMNMARLSVDTDDDGITDDVENKARSYSTRMYK